MKKLILFIISTTFLFSCVSNRYKFPQSNISQTAKVDQNNIQISTGIEEKRAPWQTWDNQTYNSLELASAETEVLGSSFESAISYYRKAIKVSNNPTVIDQARLRLVGTLLKLGKSQEALLEISKYTKIRGIGFKDLRKDYALVAAWAYVDQRKIDQSLAWFNVASSSVNRSSLIFNESKKGTVSLLKTLTDMELRDIGSKWSSNNLFSSLIKNERKARLTNIQAGAVSSYSLSKYFNASFYKAGAEQNFINSNANLKKVNLNQIRIGVLLPLSGKFASHANKVKEGIELATASQNVVVEFADTQGDAGVAVSEYQNLVSSNVSVVLGPLLVATSQAVADKSSVLGVPIISFTKKEGLTQISNTVFRLGATSSNQVQELVNFAVDSVGARNFAILYPGSNVSSDFVTEFKKAVNRESGARIVAQEIYHDDENSISSAVQRVIYSQPDAIFIPDRLEYCSKLIEQVRAAGLENVKFFGPALWSDPIAIRGYGQLLENSFYVSLFNQSNPNLGVQSFIQSYREMFKHDPDLLAAQSFDAASYVLNALSSSAGDISLLDALRNSPGYYGVTGKLNLSDDGEIYRNLAIMKVSKGEPIQLGAN